MTEVRSSNWSRMVLIAIRPSPLLSITSGGLPATKRGCRVCASFVAAVTLKVEPGCIFSACLPANSAYSMP